MHRPELDQRLQHDRLRHGHPHGERGLGDRHGHGQLADHHLRRRHPDDHGQLSGLIGGDTSIADVTCSIKGYTGHAGTYTTECTGPNSTNDYSTITYATGTLTVNAASATVTVTASSPTITYGDATPTITASYSGLLGGDTSIADVTCSIKGYTGHAGTYTTECTGRTRPTTTARSPTPRAPSR